MFCEKCGSSLPDGAKFCEHCGTKVENVAAEPQQEETVKATQSIDTEKIKENVSAAAEKGKQVFQETSSQVTKKVKGLPKKTQMILGGAAALVILIVIISIATGGKINLNKYMTVSSYGYDSVGRATYEFDTEAFREDYGKKIKVKKSGNELADGFMSYIDATELLVSECIGGSLDQADNLSNGDVVTFTWDCDDEIAEKYFGVKLKYSDIEYKVSDLEEVETFDPFAEVELEYSGIAPSGSVHVRNNAISGPAGELYFEASPTEGLNNGMTVEVSIDESMINYLAENYGAVPSATKKEYTVDGLPSYVTQLAQIPEETVNKIKAQSEDAINAYVARDWPEGVTLNSATYLGSYFLVPKNADSYNYTTELYMVYKLQVHEYREETGLDNTFDYYYYTRFANPMLLPDGTCSVDLSYYGTCSNRFTREVEWNATGWFREKTLYYYGYENLDSLFNNAVTTQIDQYTYETTVVDISEE